MKHTALLDNARAIMHRKGMSPNTERTYAYWIGRFLDHYPTRAIEMIDHEEIVGFLTLLAARDNLSASSRNLARNAISFLFNAVLGRRIDLRAMEPARRTRALPVVFTRQEVEMIMTHLKGTCRIMAELLYGSGLQLLECQQLRVRDIDFRERRIVVRQWRKSKERSIHLSPLQEKLLRSHLKEVRARHWLDIEEGYGEAPLPDAVRHAYPSAAREWGWQYLFPSADRSLDAASGRLARGHIDESVLQRAFKRALHMANISKRGSLRTLRHSFALHLLEDHCDIETVQRLLGHADIRTTMKYIQLLEERDADLSDLNNR